ncbi:hypothetical protein E2C01_074983 [Portunus trituberculatus]|uniref:Uncharacterized protein n=1 Tax=Portunus trituberculatus TaxID=210409 RepID=A0A5B7IDU1_PORTR|nr:hypothetical protein [Portunus trituberculatus]
MRGRCISPQGQRAWGTGQAMQEGPQRPALATRAAQITKPMEKTFPRLRIILVGVAGKAAGGSGRAGAPWLRAPACLPSPPPPPTSASSRTLARHRCTPLRPHDTHTHTARCGAAQPSPPVPSLAQ